IALFPTAFQGSLLYLTDPLCAVLFLFGCGFLIRFEQWKAALLSGVFFGLAWLARGQVSLAAPAILAFVLLYRAPVGVRVRSALLLAVAGIVVISPWLFRNYLLFGEPFRSDSSYYLFQDHYAKEWRQGDEPLWESVERFWHSPVMPPSPNEIVLADPGAFVKSLLF